MDKLLNISRQGGYPLCAETLQVLYDNARAVNVLLAGLNLPNKSAVILGSESFATSVAGYKYLYVVTTGNRRLVRYDTGTGVSLSDLSSAKVTITETVHDVYDNNGVEIAGVYSDEWAVIENTDNANERWMFYHLKDVLELGVYTDLLPQLRAQLANANVSLDENYGNMLCKNHCKLRMKLRLTKDFGSNVIVTTDSTIQINFPANIQGTYPMNLWLEIGDYLLQADAVLSGGVLTIRYGAALKQYHGFTGTTQASSIDMVINSEVLL